MNPNWLRRLAGRITAVIAEMNEAQARMSALRLTQDRYLVKPNQAPENYAEFLARTSGRLLHEPPASVRIPGHPRRPR